MFIELNDIDFETSYAQYRKLYSIDENKMLTISMKHIGQLHPIVVEKSNGKYLIRAGLKRYLSAKALGWKKIEVYIIKGEIPSIKMDIS